MGRYRYGLELYSVKNELEKDMPATLQRVKDMGYEAVEFLGHLGILQRRLNKPWMMPN